MRFQCEMAGFVQGDFRIRDIAFKRLGSCRQKNQIIPPPHRQQRGTARAKVLLKLGIQIKVRAVIQEQIELNFGITWAGEQRGVQRVALRSDLARIRDALRVLPLNRLRLE